MAQGGLRRRGRRRLGHGFSFLLDAGEQGFDGAERRAGREPAPREVGAHGLVVPEAEHREDASCGARA